MPYWARLANFGALSALIFLVVAAVLQVWILFGQDFVCYYSWARIALAGKNPYDYNLVVQAVFDTSGRGGNCPFYYPLWFIFPFLPLSLNQFQVSRLVWLVALSAFWLMAMKLTDRGWSNAYPSPWVRWLVWSGAFFLFGWATLRVEQIALAVFFVWALCLRALEQNRIKTAAIALAMLLLRPNITFLAFLVLFFYAAKSRRIVLGMFAVFALLLAISTLITPGWWEPIIKGQLLNGMNQGLNGNEIDARRLTSTTSDFLDYELGITNAPAILIQAGLGLFALFLIWRWRSHILFDCILALTVVFWVTPYAMQYDYALLAPAFLWVVHQIPRLNGPTRILVVVGLAFLVSILFWESPATDGLWMPITLTLLLIVTAPSVERDLSQRVATAPVS